MRRCCIIEAYLLNLDFIYIYINQVTQTNNLKTKTMKRKFIITETKPAYYIWTYEIEAETELEAMQMIEDGEVEAVEFYEECDLFVESEFEIEEQNKTN